MAGRQAAFPSCARATEGRRVAREEAHPGYGVALGRGMRSAAGDPAGVLWSWYNSQEVKEPHDAAKDDLAEGLHPGLLDPARYMEVRVQADARLAKTYSENLDSTSAGFPVAPCRILPDAAAYCQSRYANGRVSGLLKWHYCLVLYLATGNAGWLARAIPLMLQSADGTADDLRASSYIVSAHNLNKWSGCGLRDAVLASALRFARERPHSVFTHMCAHIVADLEADPGVRAEVRDRMIRAAGGSDDLGARQCLYAARRLAGEPVGTAGAEPCLMTGPPAVPIPGMMLHGAGAYARAGSGGAPRGRQG